MGIRDGKKNRVQLTKEMSPSDEVRLRGRERLGYGQEVVKRCAEIELLTHCFIH